MEDKKSWLKRDSVPIIPGITLRIPAVGEVLDNDQSYYSLTSSLTASPYTYMVQLDDMGIDYATINDWELFQLLFVIYSNQILTLELKIRELKASLIFIKENSNEYIEISKQIENLQQQIDDIGFGVVFKELKMVGELNGKLVGFQKYEDESKKETIIYNPATGVQINRLVYNDLANCIRKINLYQKINYKPGNEHSRQYLLEKERKKQKRNKRKKYEPYLENIVVALVNTAEFPYNYETVMDLSIYNFNQSFKQIQHKINFDNTMIGVYAGTVDTQKMTDKSILSFVQTNKK